MSRELLKKIITAVCAVTNDQTTLQIAKWATMAPNGHAARHLNQYLEGKGDLKVDLMRVLREDRGVQYEVHKEIIFGLREGKAKGTIPISQSVYKNKDWKFAIGSMNINWSFPSTRDKDKVHIGFRNAYRWHPKENRITQCIHQAADRLRAGKAKNYWMEGKAEISPWLPRFGPKAPRFHLVKPGETLSKIARQYFGNTERWPEIHTANTNWLKDPNRLPAGSVVEIP